MSRVIGFSLKLEGTQSTIAEIKKVEAALEGIGKQINDVKKIDSSAFRPLADGQEKFKKTLQATNRIIDAQIKALNGLGSKSGADTSLIDSLKRQITTLKEDISKLKKELHDIKSPTIEVPSGTGLEKLGGEAQNVVQKLKDIAPAIEQLSQGASASFLNKLADIEIRLKKIKDGIKNEKASGTGSAANLSALLTEEKALLLSKKELTKQLNEEAKAFNQVKNEADPTSLVGLREELKRLKAQYIILGEAQREAAEGQQLFNKIVGTNTKISNIEQSIGDFRRNVGNYQNAVQSIIPTLERLQKEGQLSQSSLLETFQAESKQKAAALREEINRLSVAFEKMTQEERQTGAGVEALNQLKTKAEELRATVATIPEKVDGLSKKFLGLGDLITGGLLTGGIVAAFGSLKEFGAGSIEEFKQAEVAISKVRAQLEATGNASGKTAEELRNIAQDIEVTTGIDGDQILDQVTSKLLTFTRIQGDAFNRAQKAAVDLGQTLGGDLSSAAQILGKALDNPLKGITLLAKSGVSLSEAQQKQVKEAIAANDIFKAQGVILGAVEARVKGVASAINNSELSGLRRWEVDWNNFKESFGKAIVSVANEFFGFVKRFNDKTLFVPVGARETQAALKDLTETITTETAAIENSFSALKEDNLNRDVKKKLIDDLVQKYPELLNKYELESASLSDLDLIQKNLTTTVKQQIFERVKAAAQEATATEIAQKKIQLAYAKRQDASGLSFSTRATIALGTGDIKKGFERYSQTLTEQISKLESEFKNQEQVLNDAFPEINQDKVLKNYQGAALKIKGTLLEIEEALKNPAISENAKKQILQFQQEFLNFNLNPNSSQSLIDLIYKRGADVDKKIKEFSKRSLDIIHADGDDIKKAIEDQVKRIEELKKKIAELNAEAITNEFDKQIAQVRAKTEAELSDLQDKIRKLETKPLVTTKDAEEIKLSKQLITSLADAEKKQIDQINDNRKKALHEAKNELIKLQNEVRNIILEGTKNVTDSNIDTSSFKFAQINREIEIKYNVDNTSLQEQLAKGEISEKEFKKRSEALELNKLNEQLKAAQDYSNEVNALYESQYQAQIKILEAKKTQADFDAEIEASLKRQKLVEDSLAGKVDDKTATNELLVIENNLAAKKRKNLIDFNIDSEKANQERVKNEQETADKITAINNEVKDNNIQSTTDAVENEAEKRRKLLQLALDTAKTIADAVYEIENNQLQAIHDQRINNLERERDARLKLVKGNSAEEDRINREFDAKKKRIDDELHKKQKDLAVKQAIINGALAITNILATVPKFDFGVTTLALIASSIASVAAQIAVIRSQSFAEGGFTKRVSHGFTGASQAPPDSTGKRPVGTATIHENEYFAPAVQVQDNKELFDELEKDRMSRKRGFGPVLKYNFKAMALKAVENSEKKKLAPVVQFKPPVLYQYSHFTKEGNNTVNISDELISAMAAQIADRAGAAIQAGVSGGYKDAVKALAENELRRFKAEFKRAI